LLQQTYGLVKFGKYCIADVERLLWRAKSWIEKQDPQGN